MTSREFEDTGFRAQFEVVQCETRRPDAVDTALFTISRAIDICNDPGVKNFWNNIMGREGPLPESWLRSLRTRLMVIFWASLKPNVDEEFARLGQVLREAGLETEARTYIHEVWEAIQYPAGGRLYDNGPEMLEDLRLVDDVRCDIKWAWLNQEKLQKPRKTVGQPPRTRDLLDIEVVEVSPPTTVIGNGKRAYARSGVKRERR